MTSLDLRNDILTYGKAHFHFEVSGRHFAYAYIRKNACSAFKDLICDTSKQGNFSSYAGSQLEFMAQHHKIRSAELLQNCEARIFVYRDPFERVISVFVNKFVVQTGNTAIFKNYKEVTGKDPGAATFETFLKEYCRDFRKRDVHIERQSRHLLPVNYEVALEIGNLHGHMSELIGSELADRYFARKANSSTYGVDSSDMSRVPADELNAGYRASGELPSKAAFTRDDLVEICKRRYALDYQLMARLT